jgi:hypothetical protein
MLAGGFRPATLTGYSEGRGARFAAVWVSDDRTVEWEARHALTGEEFQATFDSLVGEGYRLTDISGYAVNGSPRYTAIWERRDGPAWQARHGMDWQQYQETLTGLSGQGYVLTHVCGYRIGLDVQFAGIWEKQSGIVWQTLFGLTTSQYQRRFDDFLAAGMRPVCVSGYSEGGIARYAVIWRRDSGEPWLALHGVDGEQYQRELDRLHARGLRPVRISGYGDGFYPA